MIKHITGHSKSAPVMNLKTRFIDALNAAMDGGINTDAKSEMPEMRKRADV